MARMKSARKKAPPARRASPTPGTHGKKGLTKLPEVLRAKAFSVRDADVKSPDIPVANFIAETEALVVAARRHADPLAEVGLPRGLADDLAFMLEGLRVAQVAWSAVRNQGRTPAEKKLVDGALTLRWDTLALADLAMRDDEEGIEQLARVGEGERIPDLVADLGALAAIIETRAGAFRAKGARLEKLVPLLRDTATTLSRALAREQSDERPLELDLRDRLYTLCDGPAGEIRAHAEFAFRKDADNKRRAAFTSPVMRGRNRKARDKARAAAHR